MTNADAYNMTMVLAPQEENEHSLPPYKNWTSGLKRSHTNKVLQTIDNVRYRPNTHVSIQEQKGLDEIEAFAQTLNDVTIHSNAVIQWLKEADDESEHRMRVNALLRRAKKLNPPQTRQLNRTLKDAKVDVYHRPQKEAGPKQNYITLNINGEAVTRNMGAWRIYEGKIIGEIGKTIVTACRCPILIVRRLKDRDDDTEYVEVAWQKPREGVKTRIVPQSAISSKTEILKLSAIGFPAESDVAGALVSYLADMCANDCRIETVASTSQFGWSEDMVHFAPYDDSCFFYDQAQSLLSKAVRMEGSEEVWMKMAKRIRKMGRAEPRLCMAAALGAPIVQMVGGQTGIVNLSRESGTGKSVSMMVGASIYGYPESGHLLIDASSTANFAESAMGTMRSLPVFFDDMSQIKNGDQAVSDLVYKICRESTKGRMSDKIIKRRIYTWRTIAQTNYERDLSSLNVNGGVQNRVYDYACDSGIIFGRETSPTADEVCSCLKSNYGHIGPRWVQSLKAIGADELRKRVKSMREELDHIVEETGDSTKSGKQVNLLSIIMVADALAEELIFHDGILLDKARMLRDCKSETDVFEPAKAYEKLGDLVKMNIAKFRPTDPDSDSMIEKLGTINGSVVDFNRETMTRWAREHMFSIQQLCRWLKDEHPAWIEVTEEPGKSRNMKRIRTERGTDYVYRIRLWQTEGMGRSGEVTEELARSADIMRRIYARANADEERAMFQSSVITRMMSNLGFEANINTGSFVLRDDVRAKIDEIARNEGREAQWTSVQGTLPIDQDDFITLPTGMEEEYPF